MLQRYGWRSLHMVKAMKSKKFSANVLASSTEERVEAMKPFADCINLNLDSGLIQALDVKGFHALSKNLRAGLGSPNDPYFVAFARGLLALVDFVNPDDKINITCDFDLETAFSCFQHLKAVQRIHPQVRERVISLSFAVDDYLPALQAADMIAYIARLEARRQFYSIPHSYKQLLDYLIDKRPSVSTCRWGVIFADEEKLRSINVS